MKPDGTLIRRPPNTLFVWQAGVLGAAEHADTAAANGIHVLSSPFGAMAASATPLSPLSDKGSWGDLAAYPCAAPRGSGPAEAAWSSRPLPPSHNPKKGLSAGQGVERANGWAPQRRPPVHVLQQPQPPAQGEALERLAHRQSAPRMLPPTPVSRASCHLIGLAPRHSAPDALPPPAALTLTPDTYPLARSGSSSAPGPMSRQGLGLAPANSEQAAALQQACDGLPRKGSVQFEAVGPLSPVPVAAAGFAPPGTPLLQPLLHSEPSALTSLGSFGSGALRAGLSGLGSRLGSELGSGALSCDAVLLEELGSSPVLGCITAAQAAEREAMWQALRKRLEQQPSQSCVP